MDLNRSQRFAKSRSHAGYSTSKTGISKSQSRVKQVRSQISGIALEQTENEVRQNEKVMLAQRESYHIALNVVQVHKIPINYRL